MAKSNFLLVDLNEPKTKKLAETITSDTSRKILNHLAEKEDTESSIAKMLNLPISTVHYHLQKLQEAHLITAEEFHYSQKGREVLHYKLANKYIIIAPKHVSGLKEKLKGILPAALAALGISAVIKFIQSTSQAVPAMEAVESGVADTSQAFVQEASLKMAQEAPVVTAQPDIALWFLVGSVATLLIYFLVEFIREKVKK
ncbi:winged helix-turn-helix transcriptional regulator [Candidatus Woesearchaeota archaeon]|nr:winged helix-turn-helix transcriptional regulator [Candidatus Woesearchaeota archaeon]MBI2582392.1 winged helix-turn-helix transcriptional regulator [Candidatus Woesearchaeota archaeon]